MALEIGQLGSNIRNKIYSVVGLNGIFSSILNTSLLLTIIIIILIIFIYPPEKGTPVWIIGKVFLYVFVSSLTIISMHNSFVKDEIKKKKLQNDISGFMEKKSINEIVHGGQMMKATPRIHSEISLKDHNAKIEPITPKHTMSPDMNSSEMLKILEAEI